jgi:ribonuclease HII
MPLLVGIDEAGYGPLLGPLVVAASVWRVAPRHVEADLWRVLSPWVARTARSGQARLALDDSKNIFDRKKGIATLERTVLAFARAAGLPCGTLGELLIALGGDAPAAGSTLPWDRDLDHALPLDPVRSRCDHTVRWLQAGMTSRQAVCIGLSARVLTPEAFNRRLRQTRNKAAVLLEHVLDLLAGAARTAAGDQEIHVRIDRLGGRSDYRELMMAAFPERHVHELELSPQASRYRLASARSDWFVEFVVDADRGHLPVALASMLAKYLREALMERFNAYWRGWLPGLRPTAGYYEDAQRFLADIGPILPRTGIPPESFIRAR